MPSVNLPEHLYKILQSEADIAGTTVDALVVQRLHQSQSMQTIVINDDDLVSLLADQSPHMMYVEDVQTELQVYANLFTQSFFGLSLAEMKKSGRGFVRDRLHPDDFARLSDLVTQWDDIGDGEIISKDYRLKNLQGDFRWFRNFERVVSRNENNKVKLILGTAIDITEQKEAEAKALQSNAIYRAMVASMPDTAVLILDRSLKYIIAEGTELHATGFVPEELTGQTMQNIVHPDLFKVTKPSLDKAFLGESTTIQLTYEEKNYRVSFQPLYNENDISYAMIMLTNITDIKRREIEAQTAKQQLELALETANIGMWQFSLETNELEWNQQLHQIYGTTPEDIKHDDFSWREMLHPEDRETAVIISDQILEQNEGKDLSYRIIRTDGEIRYISAAGAPISSADGKVTHIIGFDIDVTDIVETQRQLNEMDNRFEVLFNSLENSVIVFDKDARILTINRTAAKTLGSTPQEVEGRLFSDVSPSAEITALRNIKQALETQAPYHVEDYVEMNNEKHWWWSSVQPIFDEDGIARSVQIISYDITEQKRNAELETDHQALQRELEKEQALVQQRQQMMSVLSHEVKTPLAIIVNGIEFLTKYRDRLTPERRTERFEIMRTQVFALNTLLDEISDQIRYDQDFMTFQPRLTPISDMLSDYIDQLGALITDHQTLQVSLNVSDLTLNLDQKLFYHAVSNIVSNAIKYSPDGGTIIFNAYTNDEALVITVRDDGIGISQDDQDRIFSPFERGDNVGQIRGTGMGLAIVREIMELHDGEIIIESELSVGTSVYLRLPLGNQPP